MLTAGRLLALLRSLWRNLVWRDRVESELDEEVRSYVDLLAAEYERGGMPPARARRAALVEMGGVEQVREATRAAWMGNALATGARELRYAVRTLRRSPGFLFVAIVTLAIGIGGATAVFTVIDAALLRPLPGVADVGRLVTVERVQTAPTRRTIAEFSYADYRDLRESTTSLTGLAAFNGTSMELEDAGGSTRVWVSFVSDNFFTVLGARPALGRFFTAGDASVSGLDPSRVVVLGHALWQSRFAGSPGMLGSTLELDGDDYTVIGVAAPGFVGAMVQNPMELFIPVVMGSHLSPVMDPAYLTSRRIGLLRLVGRLAPGNSVQDAQRDLAGIAARLAAAYPTNRGRTVQVQARTGMTAEERAEVSRVPRLLALAVAVLLLIACGNVAGLSLVRSTARRRQLATQIALGAPRAALVRQVVFEGALLATGAALLGIVVAQLLVRSATLVRSVVSVPDLQLGLDVRVLGVAFAASALTAVLVSLLPAVQLFHIPPGAVLKDGGGAVQRRVAQRVLVAMQVAASLVLLAAAATVFGAFQRILAVHDRADPRGLTRVMLDVSTTLPDTIRQLEFYRAVLARAGAEPGIAGAAISSTVPPMFQWTSAASVFRRGEEPPARELAGRELELGLRVSAVKVSSDFFAVMRIPLVRGRGLLASDDERGAPVVIVSRRLAEELWPRQDAIDELLAWPAVEGPPRPPLRVVGVAEDTPDLALTAKPPLAMYVPFAQHPNPRSSLNLAVRARGATPITASALRRLVADVNPDVAVRGGETLFERVRDELRPQRMASAWTGVFGAIALLLASIGLYGTVSQAVLQRRRELAVRSALGATPGGILVTVLGDGMRVVATGGVAGALAAVATLRLLRSLFTGVQIVDLKHAVVAAAVLALAMLSATYLPARRAARLDPLAALRSD